MSEGSSTLAAVTDPETAPLVYHTVRNMRARQLGGVIARKLRHAVVPRLPVDFDARYEAAVPSTLAAVPGPVAENTALVRESLPERDRAAFRDRAGALPAGEVTFRNRTFSVDWSTGLKWLDAALPASPTLWELQFHGFAYLLWPVLGHADPEACPDVAGTVERWLDAWTGAEATRIGSEAYLRRAWTPHSVSLRVLHWVRYYAWAVTDPTSAFARRLRRLIYKHAAFLSNHVEHDVGGNHLVENGAALAVAGLFFPDAGAAWRRQGVAVLRAAAGQFRPDGGHFEHSPMYHVQTLTRYLTVVDLLERTGREVPPELRRVTRAGTRYLAALEPPDGRLPLLNDAAFGMVLPMRACLEYASAVLGERVTDDAAGAGGAGERDSGLVAVGSPGTGDAGTDPTGYYWLGDGADRLLVDGGAVGPAHLPAHSHNDHFAVLWWVDGQRVLADTGTYEYLPGEKRRYARGVAAHNTVQYGDLEPVPTGGSYLFGRRVEPTVRVGRANGVAYFDGRYRRRAARGESYRHRRRVDSGDGWWLVRDRVVAEEPGRVRSRLHFDPGVSLERTADAAAGSGPRSGADADWTAGAGVAVRAVDPSAGEGAPLAYCHPLGATGVSRDESRYFPAFGRSVSRPRLTLHGRGADVRLGYLLSTEPYDEVAVEARASATGGTRAGAVLSLDGERVPLAPTESGE